MGKREPQIILKNRAQHSPGGKGRERKFNRQIKRLG
jgi:hypothetical protein